MVEKNESTKIEHNKMESKTSLAVHATNSDDTSSQISNADDTHNGQSLSYSNHNQSHLSNGDDTLNGQALSYSNHNQSHLSNTDDTLNGQALSYSNQNHIMNSNLSDQEQGALMNFHPPFQNDNALPYQLMDKQNQILTNVSLIIIRIYSVKIIFHNKVVIFYWCRETHNRACFD